MITIRAMHDSISPDILWLTLPLVEDILWLCPPWYISTPKVSTGSKISGTSGLVNSPLFLIHTSQFQNKMPGIKTKFKWKVVVSNAYGENHWFWNLAEYLSACKAAAYPDCSVGITKTNRQTKKWHEKIFTAPIHSCQYFMNELHVAWLKIELGF